MLPGVCLDPGAVQPRQEGGEDGCGEMRGPNQQWFQEWSPGGHQSFSHEWPHLGASLMCCLHPNFHSCKSSRTKHDCGQGTGL